MTQAGKCDTCRLRKVKCDEEKPKCGACRKRDRPCTYSYGKASALVLEDPNQLSRYGKPRVAPLVYPFMTFSGSGSSSTSPEDRMRLTTEREADKGQGVFKTFTPIAKGKTIRLKRPTAHQRKRLEEYLQQLKAETALVPLRSSSRDALAARYIDILGIEPLEQKPLSILGTWIMTIPSRIGHNLALDLAAEYLTDSFSVFWDDTFSKRAQARATKSKALKELQLAVSERKDRASYDLVLAMKLHFAAEVLIGMETLHHTIHAGGVSEILKSGNVEGADDDHYWSLLENTYADDVGEAMLAGRTSVYDSEMFLSMTYPPTIPAEYSLMRRTTMSVMHVFIQLPRLVCLVRHAIRHPNDLNTLAAAVSLAESLWQFDPFYLVKQVFDKCVTISSSPPSPDISDIISDSYEYHSIESMVYITRYWMFEVELCGLTQSFYKHFPAQANASLLPPLSFVNQKDVEAGFNIIRSLPYSLSVNRVLPLVPLRIHTPMQIAMGTWQRAIQQQSQSPSTQSTSPSSSSNSQTTSPRPSIAPSFTYPPPAISLPTAQRLFDWLLDQCNNIHDTWNVQRITATPIKAAIEALSGAELPEWLPTRVRFERENGNMVMKLDYEMPNRLHQRYMDLSPDERWTRSTTSPSPFGPQDRTRWDSGRKVQLPDNVVQTELAIGDYRGLGDGASGDEENEVLTVVPSNPYKNPCISPGWN